MSKKKAILRKVAKDYLLIDRKHNIVGKVKIRSGVYLFRGHKECWIDQETMHYINLLIWQLRKSIAEGDDPSEVTSFEPGLHLYIKDQVAYRSMTQSEEACNDTE
jgi:hypothetical protein